VRREERSDARVRREERGKKIRKIRRSRRWGAGQIDTQTFF